MRFSARDYRMPRYKEIPNVGLYLEQTVKYINECLAPIEISITPSMLSNYVKKGYIDRPIKKQYYADQIAYAIYIVIIKQVLSMDNIASLFVLQKATYTLPVAYDYFCSELEKTLVAIFENKKEPMKDMGDISFEKKMLHSVIVAVSHIIYLNDCFKNNLQDNASDFIRQMNEHMSIILLTYVHNGYNIEKRL